ncbi:potassium voltage-gated channel subfamily V member 2 [Corythoichthys intestinalis]|uniref:potassium voltage-gated channel subfamily V member 2 n=1 Tax=Corythoichthys intestinalis TaxID=161448 RepID=UPI0025A50968|nr:potassium voltage-gated channel subfamily V member 2 [Corythoichthys intestinalis]XP_061795727.1 potassium voltage-gated channel subfamily V member 2-like [Nerophis lumbriciformis]
MENIKPKLKVLKKRRSSLFATIKRDKSFTQSIEDQESEFPFSQDSSVKLWTSMDNLGTPDEKKAPIKDTSKVRKPNIVNLNVGGKVFHIPKHLVLRHPKTRIGILALCEDPAKRLTLCDDYNVLNNEFFFDRDPMFFHYIFHYYCSNVLWVMDSLCPVNFEEEMSFWGLKLKDTPRCCRILFEEKVDDIRDQLKVNQELIDEIKPHQDDEGYKTMFLGTFRKILWDLMENPYSSMPAKAFAVFSSLFVLISIVSMTMNTVGELRQYKLAGKTYMEWVEIASILFFTLEYFLRLLTTSNIKHFLKSALNFVDVVAVMPYFIQIMFEVFVIDSEDVSAQQDLKAMARVSKVSKVLKVVKLMRIFRILKLARHSTGMRAFGFTIRQCSEQVCCLFLFIAMGIFTFSALMHSVEVDQPGTPFSSIPDAWWWAAVSISTVGYGDVVPISYLGRCVAFGCISFGIILNGMPISILFNKFSDYYAKLKEQEYTFSNTERTFQLRRRLQNKCNSCLQRQVEDSDDEVHYRPGGRQAAFEGED